MADEKTDLGYAYEYGVDIDVAEPNATEPVWQPCRFGTAMDPQVDLVTEDASTYDDQGSPNAPKVGEAWTLGFGLQQRRLPTGHYLPEVEKLLSLTTPDVTGNEALAHVRYYDKPSGGQKPNPKEAFEGYGTVKMGRAQTGNTGIGGWNFTITGVGRRAQIDHPRLGVPAGG